MAELHTDPERVYLEYVEKWLTVDRMATHYKTDKDKLFHLIDEGRRTHLKRISRFDLESLCNDLKKELTGLNLIVCENGITQQRFTEVVLTFGQQAVTDAPESMKKLLSRKTYVKLVNTYNKIKADENF